MTDQPATTEIAPVRVSRLLTATEFQHLADVPPEREWFANLSNPQTKRAYENAVTDFMRFVGIARPQEFRTVTRAHIIAWRDELALRGLGGSTIRHRLASLASLFEYLCERNAVTHNPVKGVERPRTESGEGKTPALSDHQARKLLDAPTDDTTRSKRDRAILSTLLFHALRRARNCASSRSRISGTPAKACPTSRCPARAARRVSAAASRHPRPHHRLPRRHRTRHRRQRGAIPADPEQPHRPARKRHHRRRHLSAGSGLLGGAGFRDRRPRTAGDGRNQCPRPPGRHRQSAGVARSRQYHYHADLRSPTYTTGG